MLALWEVKNLFAWYLLRFVSFVTLLNNLLMKLGGISQQSSNVAMTLFQIHDLLLSHFLNFPSTKYQFVMHCICWKKKRCPWSCYRKTWKSRHKFASTMVACFEGVWKAQSCNHLNLVEFSLRQLFGSNLFLQKILYHGIESTDHWLMSVLLWRSFRTFSRRYILFLSVATNNVTITPVITGALADFLF